MLLEKTVKSIASAVQNTLSSQYHSKDFIFARSEYLRTRLATICLIFVVLTPFWTVFDCFLLPRQALYAVLPARVLMVAGLLLTLWASKKPASSAKRNLLLSGMTLALPALFYAVVLISLSVIIPHSLIGYSFIPFWLLFALLSVVMTSNHFHLSLLLRLYRQATHDPLTGLLNRVALERHTEQIEKQVPRPSIAVVLLDLDRFKLINDTYGHSVGDQVLRVFAGMLKSEARENEMICRYGGEEFLVIIVNISRDAVLAEAERIRLITEKLELHTLEGVPFTISISQGVSMLRADESIHEAIKRADDRLYMAKRKGRNCVVATD